MTISIRGHRVALFQRKQVASQSERRTSRRHAVDCPASLRLLGGERYGRLSDLSLDGACFEAEDLPTSGISGLLVWGDQEHWCKVVWSRDGSCGLVFERSIAQAVVDATVQTVEVETGPVANFSNIPLGQKRSRRAFLVSEG